jgi:amino acid transporter
MEALIGLLAEILAFIVEVTFHAVVFIFMLLMAIFSPRYRKKLKAEWETTTWRRIAIVLGITLYSSALILALIIWTPFFARRSPEVAAVSQDPIEFSNADMQQMKNTKEIDQLIDVAGDILKRKLAERKKAAEQDPAEKPDSRAVAKPE